MSSSNQPDVYVCPSCGVRSGTGDAAGEHTPAGVRLIALLEGLGFGVPTAALLLEPETLRRLGKAIADQAQRATDVAPSLPSAARALVDQQAEDEGLWFQSATVAEAYLQQELRALHAAVERECPAGVAPTVPNDGLPPFYIRRLCSQCGASDEKIARDGCPEKCGRTATETPEQHKVDP